VDVIPHDKTRITRHPSQAHSRSATPIERLHKTGRGGTSLQGDPWQGIWKDVIQSELWYRATTIEDVIDVIQSDYHRFQVLEEYPCARAKELSSTKHMAGTKCMRGLDTRVSYSRRYFQQRQYDCLLRNSKYLRPIMRSRAYTHFAHYLRQRIISGFKIGFAWLWESARKMTFSDISLLNPCTSYVVVLIV